jgi:hypothetical protein
LKARLSRIRIGLRLMFLLVALFCVLSATYRALTDLRYERMKARLYDLEGQARGMEFTEQIYLAPSAKRATELAKLKTEIAKQRLALGEK